MSSPISFVVWIVTGSLVGWLAGRSGRPPAVPEYTVTGIVGAILGGLLWAPFFFEAQAQNIYVFGASTSSRHCAVLRLASGSWSYCVGEVGHCSRDSNDRCRESNRAHVTVRCTRSMDH
jgi:uncharacterized membrane protein YeaQ/YmgE (transglycosylase-associated protein family)